MIDSVENMKNVWPHVWCPVSPPTLSLGPAVFQSFLGVPDFLPMQIKIAKTKPVKKKNRK